MIQRLGIRCAILATLLWSASGAAAAAQQQGQVLHGRVLDPSGKPVAGQDVALHRVTQSGGAMVGTARSRPDGRFDLTVPPSAPADSAVFFVAVRYNGQLYIGQPFRPPVPADEEYEVTVGVGAVTPGPLGSTGNGLPAGPVASPGSSGGDLPRDLGLGVLLLLAVGGLGWALVVWLGQRRLRSNRELLVRIAELDEARASVVDGGMGPTGGTGADASPGTGASGPSSADEADYRRRRAALVARFEAAARR